MQVFTQVGGWDHIVFPPQCARRDRRNLARPPSLVTTTVDLVNYKDVIENIFKKVLVRDVLCYDYLELVYRTLPPPII